MPRVSRQQAVANREIVKIASAKLFREKGFKSVSVADVMGAAGLTNGAFYGQFESKDALVAEACAAAFEEARERWRRRRAGKSSIAAEREGLIEGYLTVFNRNTPGSSCAAAAFVNDVAREPADAPVRGAFASGVKELLSMLEAVQADTDPGFKRQRAMADLSAMVGALVLSRATAGHAVSSEFLTAVREQLVATVAVSSKLSGIHEDP